MSAGPSPQSERPGGSEDAASGFAPHVLRDYALVADGHRGAVFGPRGDVAWLCAPGWDDEAVLAGLVGGGGAYAVSPPDRYTWGGHYEEGTLVWRNRWVGCSQTVECREALAMPSTPTTVVLLRRLDAVEGDAEVDVTLQLAGDYGRADAGSATDAGEGVFTGRTGAVWWRWSGAAGAVEVDEGGLHVRIAVAAGTHHDLVLEVSSEPLDDVPAVVAPDAWEATEAAWADAVPALAVCVARRDARHAYAVLHGLTTPGGGMVAAATTSLPEHADGHRAYDYRYVWVRDQAYTCLALAAADGDGGGGVAAGTASLLDRQVGWLVDRVLEHGADLAPVYRTDGSPVPEEAELDLPGYPGGRTVVGNAAGGQRQLDVLGDLLLVLAAAEARGRLGSRGAAAARSLVDAVAERWDEPDAGLWELEERWWCQSRLACVAGLRAWAKVDRPEDAGRVLALAERVMAEASARCTAPGGWWQRAPDLAGTDAALLLAAVRGAVPADDPRTLATLEEVHRSLTEEGYVYRFAHDGRPLGSSEGAFLLCGFVLALAEHQQAGGVDAPGEHAVAAFRSFERNRAAAGAPGLYAEEFDVVQRQLRGNLPQAFVHAMLIEAAVTLAG